MKKFLHRPDGPKRRLVEMGRFLPSVQICAAYLGESPQLKAPAQEAVLDG